MPELPEVEMMAGLARTLGKGRRLVSIDTLDQRIWGGLSGVESMGEILLVRRRGKLLLLQDSEQVLLIHFRMTGQLLRREDGRRVRMRFAFDDGGGLVLVDSRCLATVEVCSTAALEERLERMGLGEEFWPHQKSGVWWSERLGNGGIKAAMLKQNRVVGIGNIAASEILWMAQISPKTSCVALRTSDWNRFSIAAHTHVEDCLNREDGDSLQFLNHGGPNQFAVYGREGQACPRCQATIVRIVQQARSTFFCESCQV